MAKGAGGRINRLVWVLTALSLLAVMAVVSYSVDPGSLFHAAEPDSAEMRAVSIIESGQNACNLDNYNERLVKRSLLLELGQRDTLVFGSSRGALITAEMADEGSFFNLSVSGSMLEETIGLYGLYYSNNGSPERVIISVDPWFLCENFDSARFEQSLGDGYYSFATRKLGMVLREDDYALSPLYLGDEDVSFWKLGFTSQSQLFSVTYFQSALGELLSSSSGDVTSSGQVLSEVTPTDQPEGELGILRADGSYSYPAAYREADSATFDERARTQGTIGEGVYDLAGGQKLPLLTRFVDSLISDGVRVDILFVPIHPVKYAVSLEKGIPLAEIESAVRELCSERGLNTAGSYDAAAVGADGQDFYDAYHYRPERVAELVAALNLGVN